MEFVFTAIMIVDDNDTPHAWTTKNVEISTKKKCRDNMRSGKTKVI
jgi:hypothetical protein